MIGWSFLSISTLELVLIFSVFMQRNSDWRMGGFVKGQWLAVPFSQSLLWVGLDIFSFYVEELWLEIGEDLWKEMIGYSCSLSISLLRTGLIIKNKWFLKINFYWTLRSCGEEWLASHSLSLSLLSGLASLLEISVLKERFWLEIEDWFDWFDCPSFYLSFELATININYS